MTLCIIIVILLFRSERRGTGGRPREILSVGRNFSQAYIRFNHKNISTLVEVRVMVK